MIAGGPPTRRRLTCGAILLALSLSGAGCGGNDVDASNAYVDSVNVAQTLLSTERSRAA